MATTTLDSESSGGNDETVHVERHVDLVWDRVQTWAEQVTC